MANDNHGRPTPIDWLPATQAWLASAFEAPTPVQAAGWRAIAGGGHTLLIAPTGSGKTLAAFLFALDRLFRVPADAPPAVRVVYLSPLKALAQDIERNLRAPLAGIREAARLRGEALREVEVALRTGDTPQKDRQRQARRPADILVTTPESLYLILGSRARETLRSVRFVIVDEVHALADQKRGTHLALSLERLTALNERDPQRIGLSATVRPKEVIAAFLGGDRAVTTVDTEEAPRLDLRLELPGPSAVPGGDGPAAEALPLTTSSRLRPPQRIGDPTAFGISPGPVRTGYLDRLYELVTAHTATLVFVGSRIQAEKVTAALNERHASEQGRPATDTMADETLPPQDDAEELVATHHGSLAHERRQELEERFKAGHLKGLIATSSLELGVDMSFCDLVCQVDAPGGIARGLQRAGRAGHTVGGTSKARIICQSEVGLLEAVATARGMQEGALEPIEPPKRCLDVLAQHLVSMAVGGPLPVAELLPRIRRAYPYRDLPEEALTSVLDMLSGRYPSADFTDLRPLLRWDRQANTVSARRGARMIVSFNPGTIPDRGLYRVQRGEGGPLLGKLDEEMVFESRRGDTFVLGATTWRITAIERDRVLVDPAPGEAGRLPFWKGDSQARPIELGLAMGRLARELVAKDDAAALAHLASVAPVDARAARTLVERLREQVNATGAVPSDKTIVIERFRDALGDWRVSILNPLGAAVNGPWALALQAVFSRRAGHAVEVVWSNDGVTLRMGGAEEPPTLDTLLPAAEDVRERVLEQLESSALFASRFRECAGRALLLPKRRPNQRTPLWARRLRSQALFGHARRFPSFPIVLETYRECLQDVFSVPAFEELLRAIERGAIEVVEATTDRPSPFARALAFRYTAAYLYEVDAPVAERRAQALQLDLGLLQKLLGETALQDLLDPEVIAAVTAERQALAAGYQARSADEVEDLLRRLGDLSADEVAARSEADPTGWLAELAAAQRAVTLQIGGETRWVASDDAARYRDALGATPPAGLSAALLGPSPDALREVVIRFARTRGPFATAALATRYALPAGGVEPLLEALVADGRLVHGLLAPGVDAPRWCERDLLRRLRRRTLAKLRGEIEPAHGPQFARFLAAWQGVRGLDGPRPGTGSRGSDELLGAIEQLEGLSLPLSDLEARILPARVPGFQPAHLDALCREGAVVWVGDGALGRTDAKVRLYPRESVGQLLAAEDASAAEETSERAKPADGADGARAADGADGADGAAEPGADEGAAAVDSLRTRVVECLEARGALFRSELGRALRDGPGSPGALDEALSALALEGRITNDSLASLRTRGTERTAPRRLRHGLRGRGRRRAAAQGGRWFPVDTLREDAGVEARALALATSLLERYGIVASATAKAEGIPGGFQRLYPVLSLLEDRGAVRRGHFLEGLGGAQFGLAAAVDQLRSLKDERGGRAQLLASTDPANPYGALLAWPEALAAGLRPRRQRGTAVVLVAGHATLYFERGLRALWQLAPAEDRARLERALEAFAAVARASSRSAELERIDGEPAARSPLAPALGRLGFRPDYKGLTLPARFD